MSGDITSDPGYTDIDYGGDEDAGERSEGETCPFCGGGLDCSHNITVYDATCAYGEGLSRAPIEPSEPLGHEGVAELAEALLALLDDLLLERLRQDAPRRSEAELRGALDLPAPLLQLVVDTHEHALLDEYRDDDVVTVRFDEYAGLGAWTSYVDAVLGIAAGEAKSRLEWTSYLAGGPGMTARYDCAWAKDQRKVTRAAYGIMARDAQALEAARTRLGQTSPKP